MLELAAIAHVVGGTLEALAGVLRVFPAVVFHGIGVGVGNEGILDAFEVERLATVDEFVEATAWLPLRVVLEALEMVAPELKVEEDGADIVTVLEPEPVMVEVEDETKVGVAHEPETLKFEPAATVAEEMKSEVPEVFVIELEKDPMLEAMLLLDTEEVVKLEAHGLRMIADPEELEGLVIVDTLLIVTDEVELVAERGELDELIAAGGAAGQVAEEGEPPITLAPGKGTAVALEDREEFVGLSVGGPELAVAKLPVAELMEITDDEADEVLNWEAAIVETVAVELLEVLDEEDIPL
ncbi:MAG: hypothetical protein Q9165_006251 [Trypethelium subeluteriae]